LNLLKDAVPNIQENPEMFAFLDWVHGVRIFLGSDLCVAVGAISDPLLTQSSSAATSHHPGDALFRAGSTFPIAAAMILGENIGTTVTANIAAIIGNVHAKRAARFHLIFQRGGVSPGCLCPDQSVSGRH
jgi:phosphate:Na+ symporter